MDLLVAYQNDPAGHNMARFISQKLEKEGDVYKGKYFDLAIIQTPVISADWLEEKFDYDGYIFLSKHAAESGVLALTCHNTGNFSDANFGGYSRQVSIPHPHFQKSYVQNLWYARNKFSQFQITIEATHHGPTALKKPTLFIEIGTTEKEWNDVNLCNSVAQIIINEMEKTPKSYPVAICFGGTHYPEKFTSELIHGEYSLGTVIPKHALEQIDQSLFSHIIQRNKGATAALLDWNSMGKNKQRILEMLKETELEVIRL
jgi:D-aminoacyl-tRNA deacylase